MLDTRDKTKGRFSVTVELANSTDVTLARAGHLPADKIRRLCVRGIVDRAAPRLALPESIVERLGLDISDGPIVRYADGRRGDRQMATGVELTYDGRRSVFNAVVEPERDSALIGAIVLEDLDFVVDCTGQKLVPRDPNRIISEVE